ncbi:MAG: hypothetical protein HKP02_10440 [Xanthomonadales bacterium]|nr:hypothetical protein [Xanthomonadales bacterium]
MMKRKPIPMNRSGGFSLVEMMISLVLGLMVLGAVTAMYLGSSQSTQFQASVQRMEENGRIAIDILSRNLRMAGYDYPLNTFEVDQPLVQGTTGPSGALLALSDLKDAVDTIGIRYEGGNMIRDCLGAPVLEGAYVTNLYGISTDGDLVCGTTTSNARALVEGVEDMQLRYGIDLDGSGFANRYVDAGNVADWSQVVTVEISLLVSSINDPLPSIDTVCLGCTVFAGVADRKIRSEFQTVIGVRNL